MWVPLFKNITHSNSLQTFSSSSLRSLAMYLAFLLLSCTPELPQKYTKEKEEPQNINVLLITIDTLRADRVGAYGDKKAQTPNIDSLAQRGVLFREAHSHSPLTLPSHSSILTGLYPSEHGVRDNSGFSLSEDVRTITEALDEHGYDTAAFVSAFVLEHSWGLDQGFDLYHDPFHPTELAKVAAFGEAQLPSADTINAAQAWWKRTKGPKFAWVHLYDPHTPWSTPTGDPYRGDIAQVDRNLKRLLEQTTENDLIILTSDHGESLWEHGEREHGVLLHRSVTRVPLIIRPPKAMTGLFSPPPKDNPLVIVRPKGVDPRLDLEPVQDAPTAAMVVEDVVRLIDIAPTIADYTGVSFAASGLSLLPFIEGKEQEPRIAYAETLFPHYQLGWSPLKMAQDDLRRVEEGSFTKAKLWESGMESLPTAELLLEIKQKFGSKIPVPGAVSTSQQEALAALGYMAGNDIPKQDLDPRNQIQVFAELFHAESLPPRQSIQALRILIDSHPNMIHARTAIALQFVQLGELERALRETEAALIIRPSDPQNLNNAALLARQLKHYEAALSFARAMRVSSPTDVRSYRIETAIHVDQEKPEAVIESATAGLLLAPDDPNLHYLISLAYIFSQQPEMALKHLSEAKKNRSQAKDISLWQGISYERLKQIDNAVSYYDQATQDMPQDLRAWARAGVLLAENNRCTEARRFLSNAILRGASLDIRMQDALKKCPKSSKDSQ
jgi:tetratricopeptide (TPR) repeat protein